ncbi:MAG: nucleoside kinase, partial [Rikenellaceae bacterium]
MGKQREQIEVIICERERSRTVDIEAGSSLLEIATEQNITSPHKVIAAYVNNRIKQLDHKIYSPANLRFVDIMSFAGMRVYQRTISLVMQCAVEQTLPHHKLYIRHSMGPNGLYCEVESRDEESTIIAITPEEVCGIGRRMMQIVEEDAPITRHKLPTERVKKIYLERGYTDKVELLETRPRLYSEIY